MLFDFSGPRQNVPPLQKLTRYTFRFWLPAIQIATYLIAGIEQRAGHDALMHSVLKANLLIALVTQIVFVSLPLVPTIFWYIVALFTVWYFAGFVLDAAAPRILTRQTRFPIRMMVLAGVIGLCTAYDLYCWRATYPQLAGDHPPPLYGPVLFGAAWFAAYFGLGAVAERLLLKASRTPPVIQRRILLGLTIVFSGFLAWVTMHNSFEPEFTVGPNTPLDPNTPPSFWLVYPFAQIGNLLFYIFGFRLGIFLSQRKHLTPGEELVWPASRFIPRMQGSLRNLADTWNWRHTVGAIVFVWCCGCILAQDRTLAGKAIVGGLVLIFFLGWMFPRVGQYRWALLSAFIATAFLVRAGSYHMGVDIALFAVGLTAVFWYFHLAKPHPQARLQIKAFFATILLTWLLWSLGDAISASRPAPRNLERFEALGTHEDVVDRGKRIGVALSGGGYRATLMHAGVLDGLEKLRLRPTNLSAVSGGSITASYYASGGSPQELLHVFEQRQMLLYRDLIDAQNLVRLIFPARIPGTNVDLLPFYSFGRTNLNAQALDRVFLNNARFHEIGAGPKLMIDVTDLNSGRAIGTTGDWLLTRFLLRPPGEELFPNAVRLYEEAPRLSHDSSFARRDSGDQKLSKFASASAAFPIAFDPVPLNLGSLGRYLLSDGGITDNSAMTLLLEADRRASLDDSSQGDPGWLLDLAISSDGGAMFTQADGSKDQGFGRAIDIIDARIGLQMPSGPRGPQHPNPPPVVLLSPSLYVDNSRNDVDFAKFAFRYKAGDYFYVLGPNGEQLPLNAEQKTLVVLIEKQFKGLDPDGLTLLASIRKGARNDLVIGAQENPFMPHFGRIDDYVSFVHDLRDDPGQTPIPHDNDPEGRSIRHLVAIQLLIGGIAEDFSHCLETFLNTATLKDSFAPEEARDLFRLGQYLVLINEHEIRRQLADPQMTDRVASILNNQEQTQVVCSMADKIERPPDSPDFGKALQQNFEWGEKSENDFRNCMRTHSAPAQIAAKPKTN